MKITLESTEKMVTLILAEEGFPRVPARLWQGETESGIPIHCYITRVAVAEGRAPADYSQFENELQEHSKMRPDIAAIPLRLIL
jgi:hypothetical protein